MPIFPPERQMGRLVQANRWRTFSARLTAPLCIAGGIAAPDLQAQGIAIVAAHVLKIKDVNDTPLELVDNSLKPISYCSPNESATSS